MFGKLHDIVQALQHFFVFEEFGILLTVIIFVLQIFWSRWWLRRYRFGPLEWLWRSLTYGRRQPLKRETA